MKNKLLLLLSTSLMILSACNNAKKNENYIGIISAMDNEISLLLKQAEIKEEKTIGGITFHVGTLNNTPVVISRSGIGKIRASSGITSMLNNFNISKVIFTGIAGGIRDDENVLDEVIGTSIIEHDYGFMTDDGFVWGGGDPGKKEPGEVYYCDSDLVNLAYESAVATMSDRNIFKGLIATGDQFISSTNYVTWLQNEFNAYACEMEGASAAKVCTAYEKPFVVLRTLSDKADGNAHDSYADFGDKAADQSNKIVIKMLESIN